MRFEKNLKHDRPIRQVQVVLKKNELSYRRDF